MNKKIPSCEICGSGNFYYEETLLCYKAYCKKCGRLHFFSYEDYIFGGEES